ncbi:MAG TPA: hypothetical protein VEH27_02420 [Methylomirabilota bacterium]|nr:hypothetical protein [Methylomirabilota bacterium]
MKEKETKKTKRTLQCNFNEAELLAIGKDLAQQHSQLVALENDKKRVVADFQARIATVEAAISIASNKISTGYEYRDVPCTEILGSPKPDQKTVIRDDNNAVVGTWTMSAEEMQRQFALEAEAKLAAEKEAAKEPEPLKPTETIIVPGLKKCAVKIDLAQFGALWAYALNVMAPAGGSSEPLTREKPAESRAGALQECIELLARKFTEFNAPKKETEQALAYLGELLISNPEVFNED